MRTVVITSLVLVAFLLWFGVNADLAPQQTIESLPGSANAFSRTDCNNIPTPLRISPLCLLGDCFIDTRARGNY